MASVDITALQRLAINYQNDLRYLPYYAILTVLAEHGISLYPGVQDTDKLVTFLRKRGVAKPYSPNVVITDSDLGKMIERPLKVELAYARMKDNIQNYKEKFVIRPDEMVGTNKTKKHPFQLVWMMQLIRTFGEDIIDALFNAERDIADQSPMGLFDGFESKILAAIISGEISASEGNLKNSGTFAAPASETDFVAYTRLRDWLRQADPALLKNCILMITKQVFQYAFDALQNKTRNKVSDFAALENHLSVECDANIKIKVSAPMGFGQRMYLTAPNNMDFGMNTQGDEDFAQLLPDNNDPNIVKYWIQASYGTRWIHLHKKMFQTNEGSLSANRLSGDYVS